MRLHPAPGFQTVARLWSPLVMVPALIALTVSAQAVAQMPVRTGAISKAWVSRGLNHGFRIWLTNAGTSQLSDCAGGFAYLNTDDDNYRTYVDLLRDNYALQQPVSTANGAVAAYAYDAADNRTQKTVTGANSTTYANPSPVVIVPLNGFQVIVIKPDI